MAPEEEFLALRDVFFADLGENVPKPAEHQQESTDNDDKDEIDEEEEEGPRYSETDFKFEDFIKRLCHPKIVQACGLALKRFETNSVNTNHCIVKLLHRIAFDCKMYVMVFQVSIFMTFQKIFEMKELPQHKELVKFATYIIRQFLKVAEKNKKVYMEALFWKSNRDAYEIEEGYGTYRQQSAAATKLWSEEQEDELRRLFMEHQQNNIEEDVVDWIVNNLIDNTRTRRAVLKKLKEMYLLAGDEYKGMKKSGVGAKAAQSWGSEEETQLRELYEEFKEAADPLECIMARLNISRPKNRIIEKMLVMGLIQDAKEVRKKRAKKTKSGGRKGKGQRDSEGSDTGGSSSDSEDGMHNSQVASSSTTVAASRRGANKKPRTNSKKPPSKKKQKNAPTQAPRSELVKHLLRAMESGLDEALGWLKESLCDAMEDFEDGNSEGIPLVPIMDYAQSAMEDDGFQQMLKAFGICEPFYEQEAYWRIPGHLSIDTLNSYVNLLQEALDKILKTEDEINANPNQNLESDDDEDIFDKLRDMARPPEHEELNIDDAFDRLKKSRSKKVVDRSEDRSQSDPSTSNVPETLESTTVIAKENNESEREDEPQNETMETSFKKKKARKIMDSDEENEEDMQVDEMEMVSTTSVTKKGRNVIESDSEEENDRNNSNILETTDERTDGKRIRSISDSDSEKPTVKRSRVIESDDE